MLGGILAIQSRSRSPNMTMENHKNSITLWRENCWKLEERALLSGFYSCVWDQGAHSPHLTSQTQILVTNTHWPG